MLCCRASFGKQENAYGSAGSEQKLVAALVLVWVILFQTEGDAFGEQGEDNTPPQYTTP